MEGGAALRRRATEEEAGFFQSLRSTTGHFCFRFRSLFPFLLLPPPLPSLPGFDGARTPRRRGDGALARALNSMHCFTSRVLRASEVIRKRKRNRAELLQAAVHSNSLCTRFPFACWASVLFSLSKHHARALARGPSLLGGGSRQRNARRHRVDLGAGPARRRRSFSPPRDHDGRQGSVFLLFCASQFVNQEEETLDYSAILIETGESESRRFRSLESKRLYYFFC